MYTPQNGWTKQSIIDHIKTNFKGKSINKSGQCMYRCDDGKKCAVGLFIPDDLYTYKIEGSDVFGVSHKLRSDTWNPLSLVALEGLQTVHDSSKEPETLNDMIEWVEKNVRSN